MRWTRAAAPHPTARPATTATGSPELLTTAATANRPMAVSTLNCTQRLR